MASVRIGLGEALFGFAARPVGLRPGSDLCAARFVAILQPEYRNGGENTMRRQTGTSKAYRHEGPPAAWVCRSKCQAETLSGLTLMRAAARMREAAAVAMALQQIQLPGNGRGNQRGAAFFQ